MSTQAEPQRASVAPARTDKPSRTLLVGLSLGYFMVLLDMTIVSVALPAISTSLHVGLSGLQWVTNGYTITFAALLLTAAGCPTGSAGAGSSSGAWPPSGSSPASPPPRTPSAPWSPCAWRSAWRVRCCCPPPWR
ncbi:hypothetical protein ACFQ3Z_24430 [Streptomyces nogalater]